MPFHLSGEPVIDADRRTPTQCPLDADGVSQSRMLIARPGCTIFDDRTSAGEGFEFLDHVADRAGFSAADIEDRPIRHWSRAVR